MKRSSQIVLCLLATVLSGVSQDVGTVANSGVGYTLLDGSYFIDDCQVCGRPTIMQPLRGTFDLVPVQNSPPYYRYAMKNIRFTAGPGWIERRMTGEGTYTRFEEFALVQDMQLALNVTDSWTNKLAFFTNSILIATNPFPLIQTDLTQTNGTLLQTFHIQLFAAPIREVWFSVKSNVVTTNGTLKMVTAGDLLSNRGRVVKRNIELVGQLGFMPMVADLGLDAVQVTRRGEILFSLPRSGFSEKLGLVQHGDVLSNRGVIVKKNQALLAAFHPATTNDAGLDGVQLMPSGEILFSIQSNVVVAASGSSAVLSHGDILSDKGYVYRTQRQLLAKFQPTVATPNPGSAAFYVLAAGEIWFSAAEPFTDSRLGPIQAGDLLSDAGYRVFRNQDLLAAFGPADASLDYGLDGLFVVTDGVPPKPPPRILTAVPSGGTFSLGWEGEGDVFQVEHAPSPLGPWTPCSEILPSLSYSGACSAASEPSLFHRVRQW